MNAEYFRKRGQECKSIDIEQTQTYINIMKKLEEGSDVLNVEKFSQSVRVRRSRIPNFIIEKLKVKLINDGFEWIEETVDIDDFRQEKQVIISWY